MSKGKIALITILFAIATFVVPLLLLLALFSANDYAMSLYISVFGVMFFGSIGFLVAMVLSVKKDLTDKIEELKVQNAAIAFSLSEIKKQIKAQGANTPAPVAQEPKAEAKKATEKFDDFN